MRKSESKMEETKEKNISKTVTWRYSTALLLIALLATSAFFVLHTALKESESTAYVVNISGKQRMLSQHIAHDIYKLHHFYLDHSRSYEEIARIKEGLKQRSLEMLEANTILSSATLADGTRIELSERMRKLYFGETNLAQRVKQYNTFATEALGARDFLATKAVVAKIAKHSETLLFDLNRAVLQYQKEGEEKIKQIKIYETVIWLVTLFTLMLEVLFIFAPMTRKIVELSDAKNQLLESLQQKVELRTLYLKEANQKLQEMAYHDPLTGLNNRLSLESDVEFLLEQYKSHHAPFGVLMIDIDYFKNINDTYGHDFGDMVLEELATLLQKSFRDTDKIYRTGGEEFVVLLNRIGYENTLLAAHNMLKAVRNHIFIKDENEVKLTVSCGLYHSKMDDEMDYKDILKAVDVALYEAKESGRDMVRIYSSGQPSEEDYNQVKSYRIAFSDASLKHIESIDRSFEELCGYPITKFLSQELSFEEIVHPEDQEMLQDIRSSKLDTIRLVCADDRVMIFRFATSSSPHRFVLEFQSVLSLANFVREKMLLHSFNAMMHNSDDYIYFKDKNHLFTAASDTLLDITSIKQIQELIGKSDYEIFDRYYADSYYKLEKDVLSGKKELSQEIQKIQTKDGKTRFIDNRKYPIKDKDGNIIGLFGIARECKKE
jgi:diguanylate cyclase (GGDEF)-like protein/PAS domain S-box-containing protein